MPKRPQRTRSKNVSPALIERFGVSSPRSVQRLSLPLGRLDPAIRLVHRRGGAHAIPERIILDHEIVVMLSGRASYVRRDGVHDLEAGDLILIRPFVPHAFHFTGRGVEHLAIHFDFSPNVPVRTRRHTPYEVKLGNDLHLAEHSKARVSPWARAAALRILESWSMGSVLGALAARAELMLLLVRLASVSDGRAVRAHLQTGDSIAEAAVRSALSKSSGLRSVGELARVAGLSPSHLRRVVRALVGQSPAAYLRQEQVNRARRLLADPARSIKSVALDAGFASPHHFSRVFRQVDGLTPSEYRASFGVGNPVTA